MKVMKKLLLTVSMLAVLWGLSLQAQAPAAGGAATPDPGLVGQLTSGLNITPQQATGGAGAIFGLVKSKVSPAEFNKIAGAVPGMDGFLKAAPQTAGAPAQTEAQGAQSSAPSPQGAQSPGGVTGALGGASQGAQSAMGSLGSMAPGGAGGLASLAGSFQSLGLSPTMVSKFAPIMQNYIGSKGGSGAASAFAGALK